MTDIKAVHRKAMELSDLATKALYEGNKELHQELIVKSYELEAEAARALFSRFEAEPSRSILYRSAATLAQECGLLEDAEKLIHEALAGTPPKDVSSELRDLLEQVSFHRHLEVRGVTLADDEIQLALTGDKVGYGFVATNSFISRVESTVSLLRRTAERKLNLPYRDKGKPPREVSNDMELFMSVPRAASFAVTFRVGQPQQDLPGLSKNQQVIDELLNCLDLYICEDRQKLKQRIQDEAYYNNFMGLASRLEPDGVEVAGVGFTALRNGETRKVSLKSRFHNQTMASKTVEVPDDTESENEDSTVQITGILLFADAQGKSNKIKISQANGEKQSIIVPEGMMSDVVRPLWEKNVEIMVEKKGKKLTLIQIREL